MARKAKIIKIEDTFENVAKCMIVKKIEKKGKKKSKKVSI